jgi:hypothetical protein
MSWAKGKVVFSISNLQGSQSIISLIIKHLSYKIKINYIKLQTNSNFFQITNKPYNRNQPLILYEKIVEHYNIQANYSTNTKNLQYVNLNINK